MLSSTSDRSASSVQQIRLLCLHTQQTQWRSNYSQLAAAAKERERVKSGARSTVVVNLICLSCLPLQDEKYWQRRKKNNVAAKRSRDARRLKENQITVRAAFLERENVALRVEVAELRKECSRFKNVVGHYEAKFGSL